MRIERIEDPAAFFRAAGPFLEAREAQHNLLLGFRARLEQDPTWFGGDPRLFLLLDEAGDVAGAATQTPPFGVVLSELDDDGAAEAFAERFVADGLDVPSVLGPVARSRAFAGRWAELTGGSVEVGIEQRIFQATHVDHPDGVPGAMRAYELSDRELALAWIQAFFEEALPGSPEADAERHVDERAADTWLWEVDGKVVALAGRAGETPNGARVGPVYTPPELRGHGYASALTAALTAHLLERKGFCFLFTDLANPTSNSIYQRIGYRPVTDVRLWRLISPER